MRASRNNIIYLDFLIFIIFFSDPNYSCFAQDTLKLNENKRYYYFPKAFNKFQCSFNTGISITRLPTEVVEEEINTSPVLRVILS